MELEDKKLGQAFIPASNLVDCNSACTKCNMCKYKGLMIQQENTRKVKNQKQKVIDTIKRQDHAEEVKYREDMKEIQNKLQVDENFCKKFGLLKKAAVLFYYGRENDAFDEIAKAAEIVAQQKKHDEEKNEAIQRRWKFKLGLDDGFEVPFQLDKVHPDDIKDKDLRNADLGGKPLTTVKLYI